MCQALIIQKLTASSDMAEGYYTLAKDVIVHALRNRYSYVPMLHKNASQLPPPPTGSTPNVYIRLAHLQYHIVWVSVPTYRFDVVVHSPTGKVCLAVA